MLVFGVLLELAPTALTVNQSKYVCLGRHRVRRSLPRLGSRPGLLVECSDHSHYTKQSCFLAGRPHLLRVIFFERCVFVAHRNGVCFPLPRSMKQTTKNYRIYIFPTKQTNDEIRAFWIHTTQMRMQYTAMQRSRSTTRRITSTTSRTPTSTRSSSSTALSLERASCRYGTVPCGMVPGRIKSERVLRKSPLR